MKIDLGCSRNKKDGFVGIDVYDWNSKYKKGEFICGHVPEVLANFKDNSIEEVYAAHFIEHIPQNQVIETFNEIYRILILDGIFDITIPPTTGRGAWCDPTHRSYWNDLSFRYFDMSWCKELSGSYGIKCNFRRVEIRLIDEFNLHVILKKV